MNAVWLSIFKQKNIIQSVSQIYLIDRQQNKLDQHFH